MVTGWNLAVLNKKRKGGRGGGGAVMVVFDLKYHKPKILLPAYA